MRRTGRDSVVVSAAGVDDMVAALHPIEQLPEPKTRVRACTEPAIISSKKWCPSIRSSDRRLGRCRRLT